MALSPELKAMISGAATLHDPTGARLAEFRARQADAERELARLSDYPDEAEERSSSIRQQLAWIGIHKATKAELREVNLNAMARDPDA